jgi:hypothetical protein
MKLLSLWEPWATLMAIGAKRIETRSWDTNYRGWIAIHASKGGLNQSDLERQCFEEGFYQALMEFGPFKQQVECSVRYKGWIKQVFPHGCIVAVMRLQTCWPTGLVERALSDSLGKEAMVREQHFGDYSPGRWAWITTDCFRLPFPIPFRATQRLMNLPPDTLCELRKQWTEHSPTGNDPKP